MKLIWIAVDPSIPTYDQLIKDMQQVVEKHGGRVLLGAKYEGLPGMDNGFSLGTRFCLNDIARSAKIRMVEIEVLEPGSKTE